MTTRAMRSTSAADVQFLDTYIAIASFIFLTTSIMKRTITISVIMIVTSIGALAQADRKVSASTTSGVTYHISNYGIFGRDVDAGRPGFEYPRGSGNHYLYGSGLWFGATKVVRDTLRELVFLAYDPTSAGSWATPGNVETSIHDPTLYHSNDFDQTTGSSTSSSSSAVWPLWLLPGQQVTTLNPGTYEPMHEQRSTARYTGPAFMADAHEQFIVRYNDSDLERYAGFGSDFGFPLGLQIQQNVYSWSRGHYRSTVVLQYEVVNVSDDTLRNCVIGQASDPDIGSADNDRVSVHRWDGAHPRAGITSTESETSSGFESLAQILIEGPSIGDSGFIDNSLRSDQLMAHEILTLQNWPLTEDPKTNAERYQFLTAAELDGDNEPGDKRMLLASRRFSMLPGDTVHFTVAYSVVPSSAWLDFLIWKLLINYQDGMYGSEIPMSIANDASTRALSVHPNPAVDRARIELALDSPSDIDVRIVDAMGRTVAALSYGSIGAGLQRVDLDVSALHSGAYLVIVDTGSQRRAVKLTVAR